MSRHQVLSSAVYPEEVIIMFVVLHLLIEIRKKSPIPTKNNDKF